LLKLAILVIGVSGLLFGVWLKILTLILMEAVKADLQSV
jgi:hypothetical protein